MFVIRNNDDLRLAYQYINILRDVYCIKNENFNKKIISVKREIRKYTHKKLDRVLVKNYGIDGHIVLIELPEFLHDEVAADEYFRENELICISPSIYDCTGRAFTSWFKIFKRRNRFFAYHSIAYDV